MEEERGCLQQQSAWGLNRLPSCSLAPSGDAQTGTMRIRQVPSQRHQRERQAQLTPGPVSKVGIRRRKRPGARRLATLSAR